MLLLLLMMLMMLMLKNLHNLSMLSSHNSRGIGYLGSCKIYHRVSSLQIRVCGLGLRVSP